MMVSSRAHHLIPLAAVQVVGLACGLAGVVWMSSRVPPDILGLYGLLVGTQLFGVSVTHQGFVQHVQRYWTGELSGVMYIRRMLPALVRPTLVLGGALALLVPTLMFTGGHALDFRWWPWMLSVNLFTIAAFVAHGALQAEERYWSHFAVSAVGSLARTFLPLALIAAATSSLFHLSAGFLGYTIVWAAAAWLAVHRISHRRTRAAATELPANLLVAFAGAGLCSWLAATSVRWFGAVALTQTHTGYFILALNLSAIVPAAISVIAAGFHYPGLFAAARAGATDAALWRQTLVIAGASLVIGQCTLAALAAIAPHLLGTVIALPYAESLNWLLPTGGAALAAVTSGLFSNLLLARQLTRACFWLLTLSAGLRLLAMGTLSVAGSDWFRIGLIALPWPTALFEWWLTRRLLRHYAPVAGIPAAPELPAQVV